MVSRVVSTKFKYSRGDDNEIRRAKGHSMRCVGDSGIAEHTGAQHRQLDRAQSDKGVARTLGMSFETVKSRMKCMKVRRHVHSTGTRKDTLAAHHSFEPLVIAGTTAVLRLAGR